MGPQMRPYDRHMRPYAPMWAHMRPYARFARMSAYVRPHVRTWAHTCAHVRACAHLGAYVRPHARTGVRATRARLRALCAYMCTQVRACAHSGAHVCAHGRTGAPTCAHMCARVGPTPVFGPDLLRVRCGNWASSPVPAAYAQEVAEGPGRQAGRCSACRARFPSPSLRRRCENWGWKPQFSQRLRSEGPHRRGGGNSEAVPGGERCGVAYVRCDVEWCRSHATARRAVAWELRRETSQRTYAAGVWGRSPQDWGGSGGLAPPILKNITPHERRTFVRAASNVGQGTDRKVCAPGLRCTRS